jgi:hypothetical protein
LGRCRRFTCAALAFTGWGGAFLFGRLGRVEQFARLLVLCVVGELDLGPTVAP